MLLTLESPKKTADLSSQIFTEQVVAPKAKASSFIGLKRKHLPFAVLGMAAVDMVFRDPILMGIGILAGATRLAYPGLKKSKRGIHLATVAGVAATAGLGMHLYTPNAHALFFSQAEAFFNTTFNLSTAAVTVIFNVFRAIYVVYLIYSAISIWTAYNRDEDFMSVAKAPVVIFMGGTLIDVVTSIIVA